jgi:tetratricopeptide (TPR) repeat protein
MNMSRSMIKRKAISSSNAGACAVVLVICCLGSHCAVLGKADNYNPIENTTTSDDLIAPNTESVGGKNKSIILHGKAEVIEEHDNTLHALEGSRMYQRGVLCLSSKRYGVAADCFKTAGDQFALSNGNEKFLAESRFAEAQSRRLLGQKQAAIQLYKEAIDLFGQYDPHSPYLKAALDNLNIYNPALQGRAAQSRLKAMAAASGIQSVEREVYLKGSAADIDTGIQSFVGKGKSDIAAATVKKTVLQAFVKMTCLETAELGSNYYTAADRYMPLKANGKALALSATSGFLAPVIRIRLNGRFYSVGVDLPDLASSKRTVYLVTDGANVLAIDPGNYDVWKLYAKFKPANADFEWRKLTHTKDLPRHINLP